MRRLATTVMIMALFIITAQPADAQRRGEPRGGLEAVDDGSFHPDVLDPANGTILGILSDTDANPSDAEGRVVVNYLTTQGVARVNISVSGLEPGTRYEVLMIRHQPTDRRVHSLTTFVVDGEGDGGTNVVWYDPFPFNAVNVRLPNTPRSAVLSTLTRVGGIQQQVPSNRDRNRDGNPDRDGDPDRDRDPDRDGKRGGNRVGGGR